MGLALLACGLPGAVTGQEVEAYLRGIEWAESGAWETALDTWEAAVDSLYYLGEFEKSVDTHRRAVELSPGQALMWLNLADSLHFAGETTESEESFRQAAELSRNTLRVDATDSRQFCEDCATVLGWLLDEQLTDAEIDEVWSSLLG